MRNTKEIQAILSAIYCVNLSKRKNVDKDIELICRYAFNRLFNGNPNLLILCSAGKTKKQILDEVKQLLYSETKFKNFENWQNQKEKNSE